MWALWRNTAVIPYHWVYFSYWMYSCNCSCYLSRSKIHDDILAAFPVCYNALSALVWTTVDSCVSSFLTSVPFWNGFGCELLHLLCGLSIIQQGMMETLITLVSLKSILYAVGAFKYFCWQAELCHFLWPLHALIYILMYKHGMAIRYKKIDVSALKSSFLTIVSSQQHLNIHFFFFWAALFFIIIYLRQIVCFRFILLVYLCYQQDNGKGIGPIVIKLVGRL